MPVSEAMRSKIEAEGWRQESWDLSTEMDPGEDYSTPALIDNMIAFARDQIFMVDGSLTNDQIGADGQTLDTVDDDEIARRVVRAMAILILGGA